MYGCLQVSIFDEKNERSVPIVRRSPAAPFEKFPKSLNLIEVPKCHELPYFWFLMVLRALKKQSKTPNNSQQQPPNCSISFMVWKWMTPQMTASNMWAIFHLSQMPPPLLPFSLVTLRPLSPPFHMNQFEKGYSTSEPTRNLAKTVIKKCYSTRFGHFKCHLDLCEIFRKITFFPNN